MVDQITRDLRGSPDRFGYEWGAYAEILPEYEEQFRRWTVHLEPQDWRGKSFLDVGCGMGRNSYWPMTYGARAGCAVDLDERSLESARRNLACFPSVEVIRTSAYDLPFADRFDIAFAIGVIHHLEDPQRALQRMAQAVKPGGQVLIWVYGREGNSWLIVLLDPLRRALFSRLPIALVHHLSLYPAVILWLGPAARAAAEQIFRFAGALRLRPFEIDRIRSDAAANRALLAARNGRPVDDRSGSRGRPNYPGQRDVLVGDRHSAPRGDTIRSRVVLQPKTLAGFAVVTVGTIAANLMLKLGADVAEAQRVLFSLLAESR